MYYKKHLDNLVELGHTLMWSFITQVRSDTDVKHINTNIDCQWIMSIVFFISLAIPSTSSTSSIYSKARTSGTCTGCYIFNIVPFTPFNSASASCLQESWYCVFDAESNLVWLFTSLMPSDLEKLGVEASWSRPLYHLLLHWSGVLQSVVRWTWCFHP